MQIDLPLTETDAFIREHLSWLPRTDDESLVRGLLRYLKANSAASATARGLQGGDIIRSEWFRTIDRDAQMRIVRGLENLQNLSQGKAASVAHAPLLEVLMTKKFIASKRDEKRLEKERYAVTRRIRDEIPAGEIAAELDVPVRFVYNATRRLTRNLRKLERMRSLPRSEGSSHPLWEYRTQRRCHADRVQVIADYIEQHGIYPITRRDVQNHMREAQPGKKPLTLSEIGWVLRHKFHLKYRQYHGSFVRYLDPAFDEKRR